MNNISELLQTIGEELKEDKALLKVKKEQLNKLKEKYNNYNSEVIILEEVNRFLADSIKEKITDTKYKLESLVNQGLEYVFTDNKIYISIDSDFKNNKTVFSLTINKEGVNKGRAEEYGGGVLAVVAFLLKVSSIIITNSERIMIDDEGLTFLSEKYQKPMSMFIKKICEQLGFNIIMISHQQQLAKNADNIYQAYGNPKNGISFKKITNEEVV